MARNFSDASKEGDGDGLVRCWKFLMLHFKANGHTKYAVEAFNLQAQIYATLSPQMSHRFWSTIEHAMFEEVLEGILH